jgi:RHS repeat-associated protein
MFWDESNRLRVVYDQNSYQMQHYIYDAAGERTLKASSKIENVYENGQVEANNTTMGLYTTYVSPYMVVDANQKYSKHYFNGTQRVASKIGEQDITMFDTNNPYLKQANSKAAENTPSTDFDTLKSKQITDFSYYLSKNGSTTKNVKVNYTEYKKVDTNTETTSAKAAENTEQMMAAFAEIYYYHSDHLGTGTFLSDFDGNPYQFFLNLPFGETMAEQHSYSGEYTNRYKFNGKELDEETGFYYYGARYYNPKFSIWLSVDPLAEEFPNWNPYNYCMQNPINLIDPKGMSPEDGEGDPPSYNGSSFFNGMVHTEGEKSWLRVTGGWSDLTAGTGFIIDSVTVSNKPNGDTVSQRVPNAWEMLRDDSIIGSAVYETVNALTVIPQMCMFRSVSGGTMKSLDGKAMTSEAALMGFVSTGTSFFGGQVSALKAAAPTQTIVGEGMKRVSTAAARNPNSVILNNMPKFKGSADQVTSQMMAYNRNWLLQQMKSGRPILDIGLDPTRANPSIFYQMEQNMIKNYLKLHPNAFQIIK